MTSHKQQQSIENLYLEIEKRLMDFYRTNEMLSDKMEKNLKNSITDQRSKVVIITKKIESVDLPTPQTLPPILFWHRVVPLRDHDDLAPMELRLKGTPEFERFDRPDMISQGESSDLFWDGLGSVDPTGQIPLRYRSVVNQWSYSGTAEIKNTAQLKDVQLMSPAANIATAHGFYAEAVEVYENSFFIEDIDSFEPELVQWHGDSPLTKISQLVLEADGEARARLYGRFGFKVIRHFPNPDIPGNTTYWMAADRKAFMDSALKSPLDSPLKSVLDLKLNLKYANTTLPKSCRDAYLKVGNSNHISN